MRKSSFFNWKFGNFFSSLSYFIGIYGTLKFMGVRCKGRNGVSKWVHSPRISLYTCVKDEILLTSNNFYLFETGAPLIGATVQLQLHGHGFDSALTQLQIGNEQSVLKLNRKAAIKKLLKFYGDWNSFNSRRKCLKNLWECLWIIVPDKRPL